MSENKTGKYLKYAIGEIILVMVGILLALQVNNWNELRKESIKETYYLNSIQTSIRLSQDELSRVINDAALISSSADTLFNLIAVNKTDQLKGFFLDSLLYMAGDYSRISLNDGGVQEVLNAGNLDIIKDDRIRIFLASWNDRLHKIRKFEEETEYRARQYQEYLNYFMDEKKLITNTNASQGVVIPEKKAQLFQDPLLTNYLASIAGIHQGMHQMYTNERKVMDSLSVLIGNYLKQ